jgi:hypothetical protein
VAQSSAPICRKSTAMRKSRFFPGATIRFDRTYGPGFSKPFPQRLRKRAGDTLQRFRVVPRESAFLFRIRNKDAWRRMAEGWQNAGHLDSAAKACGSARDDRIQGGSG